MGMRGGALKVCCGACIACALALHAPSACAGGAAVPSAQGWQKLLAPDITAEIREADQRKPAVDASVAITQQPLLLDMSDTTVVVEWMTDQPADARARYGDGVLDQVAVPQTDGLVPVGTVHRVVLRNLQPGHTYRYQVESRRVVKLSPYWPQIGQTASSPVGTFTTFSAANPAASFVFFTDTHERMDRIALMTRAIRQQPVDFVVNGGDIVNSAASGDQLRRAFLGPVSAALGGHTPLLYVKGNHENRGPFARALGQSLHAPDGRFYYTRDAGPLHMLVLDTGEDKPDATGVYAGLNDFGDYRNQERAWFADALRAPRVQAAPFTVVLAHQPGWGEGWSQPGMQAWMQLANHAHIDLMIAGHLHVFEFIKPGEVGNDFPILVVGINQIARVDATATSLKVTVTDQDGKLVDSFALARKRKP